MDNYLGEIAALTAALSFSLTSVFFTLAGRKIDVITSLATSLPISLLILLPIHWLMEGEFFPVSAGLDRWLPLATSGILAFVVSSFFVLHAYQTLGPRLTMLIASFAPVLGAILAFFLLGQALPVNSILGIALVIFGIVWVVAEGNGRETASASARLRRGTIFAVLGTLAQGSAFVFSSQGVADGFAPISATLMRISAGVATLWVVVLLQSKKRVTLVAFQNDSRTFLQIAAAAITGPVIAGSLLLFSFQKIPVGVATTLSHTTAIWLIPIGYLVFKERISPRAIVGTVTAIVGIAILFS